VGTGKTRYLGQHEIMVSSPTNVEVGRETFHLFTNDFSFIHLEEDFVKKGGAHGAKTIYMFREVSMNAQKSESSTLSADDNNVSEAAPKTWQLAAVVSNL